MDWNGFKTIEFEEAWKKYTKLPHAHFLQSNTVGLHLALNIFKTQEGWEDGDEVITTPLTFVSSNHVILYEKLQPVFADVDETLCLCPNSVEEKITNKTKAIMYVGMGGNAGNLKQIMDICKQYNLKLDLSSFKMERSTSERFNNRAKTMNMKQLKHNIDSLKKEINDRQLDINYYKLINYTFIGVIAVLFGFRMLSRFR